MTQEAQVVKWNCPCGNSYKFHGFTEAPQRTWVGLTDAERDELADPFYEGYVFKHKSYAKAVEAKLKEKNA